MTSFFIPDSAPVFAYSSSWSAAYHSLPSGQDETFHQTETEGTISFNLTGTPCISCNSRFSSGPADPFSFFGALLHAIQRFHSAQMRCPVSCKRFGMDGWVWHPEPARRHTHAGAEAKRPRHAISRGEGRDELTKDKVSLGRAAVGYRWVLLRDRVSWSDLGRHQNVTIDDGAPQFAFSVSAWSHFPPSQSTSEGMPQEVTAAFGDLSAAFNRTMTVSSGAGSTAELRFQGEQSLCPGV